MKSSCWHRVICPVVFLIIPLFPGAGCQESQEVVGLKMPPPPPVTPFEGPGYRMEVPEGWAPVVTGKKVTIEPPDAIGKAVMVMELLPYAAGETPESVVSAALDSRLDGKKYIELKILTRAGIPVCRHLYSVNSQGSPDRRYEMLAFPQGKIEVHQTFQDTLLLAKYSSAFERTLMSVRFP